MKNLLLLLLFSICTLNTINAQTPAFPGAEGFARYTTTGGRGGDVYHVTNLNDSGSGSLREGLKKGNRIIVFDISGTIELKSKLNISNDNITIAGQTAPGDGICLKNFTMQVSASNIIIRFIRSRLGDQQDAQDDAMWGRRQTNVIIDHCTMSWSTDECASFYDNKNFTMQWCLLSESLTVSIHEKGNHGYGGIWGGQGASFHHNLLAHHSNRTPRMCGSRYTGKPEDELVDFRNNVTYNWGAGNGAYAGEGGSYNFINNYYKLGPYTAVLKPSIAHRIFEPYADNGGNTNELGVWGTFHLDGNYFDDTTPYCTAKAKENIAKTNANNWEGLHPSESNASLPNNNVESIKSYTAYDVIEPTTHTAEIAYKKVLDLVGASLRRDIIDTRIINEVINGDFTYAGSKGSNLGLIDTPTDTEGYIEYAGTTKPTDANNDGIADAWTEQYMPVGKVYNDIDEETGYTYIELYINSLVDHIMKAGCQDGENSPSINDFDLKGTSTNTETIIQNSNKPVLYKNNGIVYLSNLEKGNTIYIYGMNGQLQLSIIANNDMMELEINQPSIIKVIGKSTTTSFKVI